MWIDKRFHILIMFHLEDTQKDKMSKCLLFFIFMLHAERTHACLDTMPWPSVMPRHNASALCYVMY